MSSLLRRSFLKTLGASTALALPFAGLRRARGQDGSAPKRLLVFARTNGNTTEEGQVRLPTADALALGGTALASLEPLASKVTVVSGLRYRNFVDPPGTRCHHAYSCVLTAQDTAEANQVYDYKRSASQASIDRHVADAWADATPLPFVAARSRPTDGDARFISYAGPPIDGRPNTSSTADTPGALWDRLFGGLEPSDDAESEAQAAARARRRVVQTRVESMLAGYRGRLHGSSRDELDKHVESVRGMLGRLEDLTTACEAPPPPGEDPTVVERFSLFNDLLVEALRCDMTRVATMFWLPVTSWQEPDDGSAPAIPSSGGQSEHDVGHDSSQTLKRSVDRFYVERFADLVAKMDAIDEGDGTMLDHSIVVLCNRDASHRYHSVNDLTWIMAGSAGGALKTGQSLRWASGSVDETTAHSHLLKTICEALGVDPAGFARDDDRTLGSLLT